MSCHMQCPNLTLLGNVTPAVYHTWLGYIPSKPLTIECFGGVEAESFKLIFENDQQFIKFTYFAVMSGHMRCPKLTLLGNVTPAEYDT